MNVQAWVSPHEHAGGARVVKVDVAQQQMAEVGEAEAALSELSLERRDTARRATVEEREPVLGLEDVAADDARAPAVVEVDQVGDPAIVAGLPSDGVTRPRARGENALTPPDTPEA